MQLKKNHLQFCKHILGVRSSTQNIFVYGELARTPLICKRYTNIIRYWFKVLNSDDLKYVSTVYKMMLNDLIDFPNKKSWAFHVKHILQTYGFNDVWINQGVGNVRLFINIFKQRVKDNYIQSWTQQVSESSRASSYSLFCNFGITTYFDKVNIVKYRKALTRLRVSAHNLEIESGRWHKPNKIIRSERKCRICNVLEDEFHFLLVCPLYHELRVEYIKRFYWVRPNIPKFVSLLSSENQSTLRRLAAFVYKSFELRNRQYYMV